MPTTVTRQPRANHILLVGVIFLLALLPRVWTLHTFVTWDELTWTYRALKFLAALRAGDWAGTYLTGHPGVVTMWAGALGLATQGPDLSWIASLPPFDEDDVALVTQLASWLPVARLPVALLTAAIVAGAYALLRRLVGGRVALLAGLFLAFDPFFLAHSRVLHLDALMSGFILLSVLSLLAYLISDTKSLEPAEAGVPEPHVACLLLSGALAGLAALEKSPALFLVPFAGLLIVVASLCRYGFRPAALFGAARLGIIWAVVLGVVYVILWPALWADPVGTLSQMWSRATLSAGQPREAVFFMGQVLPDPGPLFYPLILAFRLTPVTMLGLVITWLALLAGHWRTRITWLTLLAYVLLFTGFMATNAKKFDRYILPAALALDVLAAAGWVALWVTVQSWFQKQHAGRGRWDRLGPWAGVAVVALFQMTLVLPYHPHYLACYNPLMGGGSRAAQVIPVGWGEGMEQAAYYLNARPNAPSLRVATPSVPLFAPFFAGQTYPLKERALEQADYAVLYVDDAQIGQPALVARIRAERVPEHVVRLHGIEYAWIYRLR